MAEYIEKQAAIDAVEHITSSMSVCVNSDECHGMKRMQRQAVIELVNLPSAQPEIVRCKDCIHYDLAKNGHIGKCNSQYAVFNAYHFCSYGIKRGDAE